jgi:hypothetical protein
MKLISYSEARNLGLKRYFTGKPCKNGHISERTSNNATCVECANQFKSNYRSNNKEKISKQSVEYSKKNRDLINKTRRKTRTKPENVEKRRLNRDLNAERESNRLRMKAYRENHPEEYRLKVNRWALNRKIADPSGVKSKKFMYSCIRRMVKDYGAVKTGSTCELVGYTRDELICHIENLFVDGMSWDNYGEWHIDHIKPMSLFFKEGINDPSIINALTNLQPLWALDNIKKGSNYG